LTKAPGHGDQDIEQDDPKNVDVIERLRAKLARHNKEAEQLAEAMRRSRCASAPSAIELDRKPRDIVRFQHRLGATKIVNS